MNHSHGRGQSRAGHRPGCYGRQLSAVDHPCSGLGAPGCSLPHADREVHVHRSWPNDFLPILHDIRVADRVLHAPPLVGGVHSPISLFMLQSLVLFSLLWYKVVLTIDNMPVHAWLLQTLQLIIGSACQNFEINPVSLNKMDLSRFFMVAWAIHPNLIPIEVGCVSPEPEEPFMERAPPAFSVHQRSSIPKETHCSSGCSSKS
jgi:hypothetical protein